MASAQRPWIPLAVAAAVAGGGCGSWQRVGTDTAPDPNTLVPRLFDATAVYRGMGFFAQGAPLPFVATVRFLAAPDPDSSLGVFGLSLANNALSFRRSGQEFEARYRVEVLFRQDGRITERIDAEQTVRVASFQETLRADESVIFQQFVQLPVGTYETAVVVRDQHGGAFTEDRRELQVPRFPARGMSDLVTIYEGTPRKGRGELPAVLVNPRATAPYGLDSLLVYVEGYGQPPGTQVWLAALSRAGDTLWSARLAFVGDERLASLIAAVPPADLPVGELQLLAVVEDVADTIATPALVSFSDQWVITNFDEVLSLLRYFGEDGAITAMRGAPPEERSALWRDFWEATDPNPVTPENEALSAYFRRLQIANIRFREAGDPGWLTDRGEVFITIGEPDEVFDQSSGLQGQRRIIRWHYIGERLTLDFVDETGFGRFRLTPVSRSEFQRVLNRLRR